MLVFTSPHCDTYIHVKTGQTCSYKFWTKKSKILGNKNTLCFQLQAAAKIFYASASQLWLLLNAPNRLRFAKQRSSLTMKMAIKFRYQIIKVNSKDPKWVFKFVGRNQLQSKLSRPPAIANRQSRNSRKNKGITLPSHTTPPDVFTGYCTLQPVTSILFCICTPPYSDRTYTLSFHCLLIEITFARSYLTRPQGWETKMENDLDMPKSYLKY